MKYALLFPGQGSQTVGMGKDLIENSPAAKAVFDEADAALGFSLSDIILNGPEEKLTLTAYTQPALLTMSIAVLRALEEKDVKIAPACVAGHSLGEYTALVANGVLSLADGVRLVHMRGSFMQEAVPEGVGAMAAILGLEADSVRAVCEEAAQSEVCEPANFNTPVQTVISGHAAAVARAVAQAAERGAKRSVMLKVSAPFHCSLMRPVAESPSPRSTMVDCFARRTTRPSSTSATARRAVTVPRSMQETRFIGAPPHSPYCQLSVL